MEVLWTLVKRRLIPTEMAVSATEQAMAMGDIPLEERELYAARLVERRLQEAVSASAAPMPAETREALAVLHRALHWKRYRTSTFTDLTGYSGAGGDTGTFGFEIPDQTMEPAQVMERRETVRQILQAAHDLPPDQKAAFVLTHVLELSVGDVCAALPDGKSYNAVSCLLNRARGNVRSRLRRRAKGSVLNRR